MKKKKSKAGRKPLPEGQKATPVKTTVSPPVLRFLERIGDGSANVGVRRLAIYAAANEIDPAKPL